VGYLIVDAGSGGLEAAGRPHAKAFFASRYAVILAFRDESSADRSLQHFIGVRGRFFPVARPDS
jgi:hypothetical protein